MTTLYCDNCGDEFKREQVKPNTKHFCCPDCYKEYSRNNKNGWHGKNKLDIKK